MNEKAILAIEEALLSTLFTQRAVVELLIKKGIIQRKELEQELLQTETETIGAGRVDKHIYLEKRSGMERRKKSAKKVKAERRSGKQRRCSNTLSHNG